MDGLLTKLICHEFWSHLTSLPSSVVQHKVIENSNQGEYHKEVHIVPFVIIFKNKFKFLLPSSQETWLPEDVH